MANVVPALRLSYHHLSTNLKRCFSYCAIFPKGYMFDRKTLVLLWMAENFVKPDGSGRRIEDIGEDYLEQLLSYSFFIKWGDCVIMHDLMHDLAEAVSGVFFARIEPGDTATRFSPKVRYISFFRDCFADFSKYEGLHEALYVRTFVPLQNWQTWKLRWNFSNEILVALIPQFYCLHVLSLANYKIHKLPESIKNLKQLRYLDVSGTEIIELPESVCTLCNLQSLLLSGCDSLKRLPAHLSRLVSLRHLDISKTTSLREMPIHMSKLRCLQTLSDFVVSNHCGQGINELRELHHIRGKLALRRLQNISSSDEAVDANLSSREKVNELAFEFDDSDNDDSEKVRVVLENLKPHPNLERLTIRNYPSTQFPSWLGTQCSMYENIVEVSLDGSKYCTLLPPLGQLPSLAYLNIGRMDYIMEIGPEFYAYESGFMNPFPVLHKLIMWDMKAWKEWSGHEVDGRIPFPCLEKVYIVNCPELRGNLPVNVRSAKVLYIKGCESLESSLLQQLAEEGPQVSQSDDRALVSSFHLASKDELKLKGLKESKSLLPKLDMLSCLETLKLQDYEYLNSIRSMMLSTDFLNNLYSLILALEDTLPISLKYLGVYFMNLKTSNFIESGDSCTRVEKQKQRRRLFISKLEDVNTEADAQAYNLRSEEFLEELVLEWSATSDDLEKARTILTALKPHKTLARLTINNYLGTSFPQWVEDSAFYCLRTLQLNNCSNCISLPSLGELPSLVYLSIKNFNSLQVVGPEFCGRIASQSTPFGKLKILHFEDLPEWQTWVNDECEGRAFPNLQELSLTECSQLVGKLPAELQSLRKLEILDCEQLNISLPQLQELTVLKLQNCELVDLANLTNLSSLTSLDVSFEGANNTLVPNLEDLISLSYLRIAGPDLHNLCNINELKFPSTLDTLFISQPVSIVSSPLSSSYHSVELLSSLHVLRFMPFSLTSLSIGGFNDLNLPQHSYMSLQYLSIHDCYLSEPLHFPLGDFMMLEFLEIKNCFHLQSFDITSASRHEICLPLLNELSIDNCPDLLSFPSEGFAAPNLRTLSITNCKNLLSLPEDMHTCMTSLLSLSLKDCPDIDSFPRGGLPSSLQTLHIRYCKRLTSNWKQWKLEQLVSLTRLEFQGFEEVECFPPQGWLPACLTTLVIAHFPALVFLIGEALQQLTSLQELQILYCQELLSLPEEGMPPSLNYLGIYFCPLLEERCQRDEGEDWPKISHIPGVTIDFQEI